MHFSLQPWLLPPLCPGPPTASYERKKHVEEGSALVSSARVGRQSSERRATSNRAHRARWDARVGPMSRTVDLQAALPSLRSQQPQVKECNRLALGLRASDLPSDGGSLDGRADRRRVAGTAGPSGCPACRTGSSTGTVRPSRPANTAAPLAPCPRARSAANSPWWRRSPPLGGFAKCGLPPPGGGPTFNPHPVHFGG